MFSLKLGRVAVGALAMVLALSVVSEADAWTPKKGKGPIVKVYLTKNYNYYTKDYYTKYYCVAPSYGWASSCYDADYGCMVYYDRFTQTFFYWCVPDRCFYPLSYCPYGTYSWQ
jgi:hypothetical protein